MRRGGKARLTPLALIGFIAAALTCALVAAQKKTR